MGLGGNKKVLGASVPDAGEHEIKLTGRFAETGESVGQP